MFNLKLVTEIFVSIKGKRIHCLLIVNENASD